MLCQYMIIVRIQCFGICNGDMPAGRPNLERKGSLACSVWKGLDVSFFNISNCILTREKMEVQLTEDQVRGSLTVLN